MNQKIIPQYKYYTILIISFFTILFAADSVVYKLVKIDSYVVSAASLIFPITYLILDIIAEVYGYQSSRQLIWLSIIFDLVFTLLVTTLINTPSPMGWGQQTAYSYVFHNMIFISGSYLIATPIGSFTNTYLISKWKVLLKGKYFLIRSIFSTAIGEFFYSAIAVLIIWHGTKLQTSIPALIIVTYLTKLIWTIIGALPASAIVIVLKRLENVDDSYNYSTDFNPFKMSLV